MKKFPHTTAAGLLVTKIYGAAVAPYVVDAESLESFFSAFNGKKISFAETFNLLVATVKFYGTKNRFSTPIAFKAQCALREIGAEIPEYKNGHTLRERAEIHPDEIAIDNFAFLMKEKMAKSRKKGRSGWDNPNACTVYDLSDGLHEHLKKGDPVDVAIYSMMISTRQSAILKPRKQEGA